jgi:hypothetical protein
MDKWAYDLTQMLETFQKNMPNEDPSDPANDIRQRFVDLKTACEEIQSGELRVPKTKLCVTRAAFITSFYQRSFDDALASTLYVSIIFPFVLSLLEKIIPGSKDIRFTIDEFLKAMHSKNSSAIEWYLDKKDRGNIMKVAKIYNLIRFFSFGGSFSIFKKYTAFLDGLNPDTAYIEFMTLIADAERMIY